MNSKDDMGRMIKLVTASFDTPAAPKKKSLKENVYGGIPAAPTPEDSYTYSNTKNSADGTLSISANAKSMDGLREILKLAGVDFTPEMQASYGDEDGELNICCDPEVNAAVGDAIGKPSDLLGKSVPIAAMGYGADPTSYTTDRQPILDRLMLRMQESFAKK